MHRTLIAATTCLALLAGCGGGGSSSTPSGNVSVLLQDAPLITVNGKTWEAVNVTITAFEASDVTSPTYNQSFTTVSAGNGINLLDLASDLDFLAFGNLPNGRYDRFRLTVDPGTAQLVEVGGGSSVPLKIANPSGQLTFAISPPVVVDNNETVLIVDWRADRSVRYDAVTQEYILSGVFHAFALNRQAAPVQFRALPGRVASNDGTSLRVRLERHNRALYKVTPTATATIVDEQGNPLQFSAIGAGDFVIISGSIDGNADVTATRIRRLPSSNHQPGHSPGPGPGPGGSHNGPPPNGTVFAFGAVHNVDHTAKTFVLRTPHRGPVAVKYDPAQILDARVRPPAPTPESSLDPSGQQHRLAEVSGTYIPPTAAQPLPGIDATGQNGRVLIVR